MLEHVSGLLTSGDAKTARVELEGMLRHPGFQDAPDAVRFAVYFTLGLTEFGDRNPKDAYQHLAQAGEVAPALRSGVYWQYVTLAAMQAEEGEAAAEGLLNLTTGYPEIVLTMGDVTVFRVLDLSSHLDDRDRHIALLEALWSMGYQPEVGDQTMEIFWLELLASYLDKDQVAKAEEIAGTVQRARSFVVMSVDARFAAYRPADPYAAQAGALEAELSEVRGLAAENPKAIGKVSMLAATLRKLGDDDEALAVLQASLDALGKAPPGVRVFEDQDTFLPSVLSAKAEILLDRGDADGAIAAQRLAMEVEESFGTIGFWERIKLAEMYAWLERPTEALDTLTSVTREDIGIYSTQTMSEVRVCANQQLGNIEAAREELGKMAKRAGDAYAAYRMALLCVGDLDTVEKLIASRITDPQTRLNALVDLQRYPLAATAPSYYRALVSAYDGLADRPTLKVVLDEYGRVLSWPMPGI